MDLIKTEVKVGLTASQARRLSIACETIGLKQSTLCRIAIDKELRSMGYAEQPASVNR
jgi:hypothetical protein